MAKKFCIFAEFFYIIWIARKVIFCRIISQNIITKQCFVKIGGGLMALRKCNSTSKKGCATKRATKKTEASTDNARSRTTAKKTSRIKNCN